MELLFFGRFHPLLVHFPIAILLLAFLFELLSSKERFRTLRDAVMPSLVLGVVSAFLSVATGYILSQEGGYEEKALLAHQVTGIVTAVFSLIVLLLKWKLKGANHKNFVMVAFSILTIFLVIAGHLGASLTHGEDFLTEYAPWNTRERDEEFQIKPIANLDQAVVYDEIIHPVLQRRCFSCHSSRRQKGDLRLDTKEFILMGGKNGVVFTSGLPEESELYVRLTLPLEDEHHMPPKERDQLSSAEIELVRAWIEGGADFSLTVENTKNADKIRTYWRMFEASLSTDSWLPEEEVAPANPNDIEALRTAGVLVMPVAEDSHYLMVSFVNVDSVRDAVIQNLSALKNQLVFLRLDRSKVSDEQMSVVGNLSNLRRLNLEYTSLGDAAIESISALPELQYLNLAGTKVTDQSLEKIAGMNQLRQVYLYQTNITSGGMESLLQQKPSLHVDTGGYVLPFLVTDTVVYRR